MNSGWGDEPEAEPRRDRGPDAPVQRGDAAVLAVLVLLVLIQNEPVAWLAGLYAAVAVTVAGWLWWPERWRR